LRERWLVAFVVAVPPVTDQIDQKIEAEADAVFPCEARRLEDTRRDRPRSHGTIGILKPRASPLA
jgi:hypothetical protein